MKLFESMTVEYDFASNRVTAKCWLNDGTVLVSHAEFPRPHMDRVGKDAARDLALHVIERTAQKVLWEAIKLV